MCTAITLKTGDHYFGRNLDYEHGFGEQIIITPRNFFFTFNNGQKLHSHYAIIGMGIEAENYPLYFDATNEAGLSVAGLNFPENAHYTQPENNEHGISPYEFIPWLLSQCKTVQDCRQYCNSITLINKPFNEQYPLSPLHWIIADRNESIVIESVIDGLHIYDNPYGVLTNNPPFPYHLYNISNYINVTAQEPNNRFAPEEAIHAYSRGMGGIGLPGDNSSASRFIRALYTKLNSKAHTDEDSSIVQFFHILNAVCQVNGCTAVGDKYEKTLYSSCCNTDKGIYYYTTYENPQITAVYLHNCDLEESKLIKFEINRNLNIITSL